MQCVNGTRAFSDSHSPVTRAFLEGLSHRPTGITRRIVINSRRDRNGCRNSQSLSSTAIRPSLRLTGPSRPRAQATSFPRDYADAISQAQKSTKAALADGKKLVEVEFPAAGLTSVSGDGEGGNEMTYSLQYLRSFCRIFQQEASSTRIYLPDQKAFAVHLFDSSAQEMWMASGEMDGSEKEAVFGNTKFKLDYLTKPSFLHDIGLGILDRIDAASGVQLSDENFVMAYPHFNVGEMVAVKEIYDAAVEGTNRSLVIFNGELDRIRSGYYPSFFYPGLAKMAKEWLPQFCTAYYIHNFKGRSPGVLYRAYPADWQVFRREGQDGQSLKLIHEQPDMPTLKAVSLDILPSRA